MFALQRLNLATAVLLTAGLVLVVSSSPAFSQVIISEIMYNPDGSDTDVGAMKEWVELYNPSSRTVDLSGWTVEDLQDNQVSAALPAGTRLGPGDALVVTGDASSFDQQWGGVAPTDRRTEVANFPTLANSPSSTNETIGLRDAQGQVADAVNYDDEAPWPTDSPDGASIMLLPEGLSAAGNDQGAAWKPSMWGVYGASFAEAPDGSQDRASPGYVARETQSPFEPSPDAAWSMVVLPDTQAYVRSSVDRQVFDSMTGWIADHHDEFGVQFVLHEGDIVNQNSQATPTSGDQSGDQQWQNAKSAMRILDGVVPYAFSPGNHDYGATNAEDRSTQFNDFFTQSDNPLVDPQQGGTLQSVMTPGELDNSLHAFTAPDGREMLVLTTEWGPRQAAVDWANRALRRSDYLGRTAVLLTHAYLYHDETRLDQAKDSDNDPSNDQGGNPHDYPTGGDTHDGEELWQELVAPNSMFEMVFSGHIGSDGVGYLASEGDAGQTVHQMLFDTQFETNGGNGWLRLVEFLDDGRTVRIRTYSPWHDLQKTDAANTFEFTVSPLLPGDYNDDGAVDAADYSLWRDQAGQEVASWSAADGNGDGIVDAQDYQVWRKNFGSERPAARVNAAPEPVGWTLPVVAGAVVRRRRRRWSARVNRQQTVRGGWFPRRR